MRMAALEVQKDIKIEERSFEAIDSLVHKCLEEEQKQSTSDVARVSRGIKLDSCKRTRDRLSKHQTQGRSNVFCCGICLNEKYKVIVFICHGAHLFSLNLTLKTCI